MDRQSGCQNPCFSTEFELHMIRKVCEKLHVFGITEWLIFQNDQI